MTQEELLEMAQECNLIGMRPHLDGIYSESLVAFADLVAAKEREACAKVVDDIEAQCIAKDVDDPPLNYVAKAIRDRGEA